MKAFLATTSILTMTLLWGGCATKKYVRNTTAPIQAKVDQVGEQTTKNGEQIADTRDQVKQVDTRAQAGIKTAQDSAAAADQHAGTADQHAGTADQHATDAMASAKQANQLGERNAQGLESLRGVVANLDDYKMQTQVAVQFDFNKFTLSGNGKDDLDKIATAVKSDRRYFIAVEGYTDSTGSKAYNDALSRHRAEQVVQFLVTKYDVPIFRIYTIGLGQMRPVDEAHNRTARAKNRRVEVKVFTASTGQMGTTTPTGDAVNDAQPVKQ
jgi:outer membrane protein OmpA-like peptidoglycan-associated protein